MDEPLPEIAPQQEEAEERMSLGTIVLLILCIAMAIGLVLAGL